MAQCTAETILPERRRAASNLFPGRSGDFLPSKFVEKMEVLRAADEGFGSRVAKISDALPDLAGLALPPAFTGDVCTIMGDGAQRSSAGTAVGILIAPILAVSRFARILGIDLSPQSFGIEEPDFYAAPASAAARLDALEFRLIQRQRAVNAQEEKIHENESLSDSNFEEEHVTGDGGASTQPAQSNEAEGEEFQMMCSVCQCDFEDGEYAVSIRKCHHSFHAQCLRPWLDRRHTCPMCRESVEEASKAKTR